MNSQKIIVNGILSKGAQVLIARRPLSKKIAPGKYHLPGGHVEFGEEPADALAREFREEFGLTVRVESIFRAFSYVMGGTHTVGLTYLLSSADSLDEIKIDPEDNDIVEWVGRADLEQYFDVRDHDRVTLETYFKEL